MMQDGDSRFYRKGKKRLDLRALLRKLLRNKRLMLLLIVSLPVAAFVLFGNRGVLQRIRLERQKQEIEESIRTAEAETKALQSELQALDGDRKTIEKVAREKHGMIKEGEEVYKVSPEH
jgi:cell division protein FtsB